MDEDFERQDLIDKYLLDKMSTDEKVVFENSMKKDPSLEESVNMQGMILGEINQRENFNKIIETKSIIIPFYIQVLALAAMLIGIFIWQPWFSSDTSIFSTYSTVLALNSPNVQPVTEPNLRGDECEFENLTSQECQIIRTAVNSYNKNDFINAGKAFETVLYPIRKNYQLSLYMGICEIKVGNINRAISTLNEVRKAPDATLQIKASYYLALSYIEIGERSKAKIILKELSNFGGEYSVKAKEILRKLRWF